MGIVNKARVLVVLVILIASSVAEKPSVVEARTLSLTSSHQGYSKFFATLGLVCKCCDGVGGACTSTWTESCSNLQCSPWKSHS
ncbi:hypothetical protein AAZX31_01G095500 [Glycine max]|uniref:Uncharacterized protein n=2 Tax=Glycine subgen. Soja TaxID=1462606 RepID=I1J716_SOYBN|nr:uncharacterized protein LOC100806570 [Glycine max]XP_028235471.1 uncharacterized protein LOC114415124 [Glycine soja]KAG5060225.1 hypothetical protein JHK87_001254 [Glycine soja]KAG5068906.1 hypothetical protein JHK85_001283 [Glycine max]KAG5088633.1 hypothetical protein JHK86_001245 [Glycine max]KAH1162512.1 hypothetical protein GYH30_001135 [Glycine max]KHN45716.1 hypothetical protein glysoja_048312 [Glycine soja]|eukprot:XP_003516905.1 uncharacterized protein LOC100806570 [Glycine max]